MLKPGSGTSEYKVVKWAGIGTAVLLSIAMTLAAFFPNVEFIALAVAILTPLAAGFTGKSIYQARTELKDSEMQAKVAMESINKGASEPTLPSIIEKK